MGAPVTPVTIEAIEDAMKARIAAASTSGELGYRLGSVASYEGEFDDLDSLALSVRTFPAVWVVLADMGKPEAKGADKWLAPCTFGVMVGARSVRNAEAARRGGNTAAGVEPGSYRMLQDMWSLFVGQDLGLAIDHFKPGKTLTIFQTRVKSQGISVLGLELHTKFVRTGRSTRCVGQAPELLTLGLNYHLTPDDGKADAADLVTLGPEEA